jgi:hypothetical protein
VTATPNPALRQFAAQLGEAVVLAQVLVCPRDQGFELRHIADRSVDSSQLREVTPEALRTLAQFAADGTFRPLKSAPNLASGWRTVAADVEQLGVALEGLYPGAIADWFAARGLEPPVTHYRKFTERQTGMYRLTTMLDDVQAGRVAVACCDARFCLKRRLWTVPGLAADEPDAKSVIPCLEPCAVLLEFARKTVRLEQEDKMHLELSAGEVSTIQETLRSALESKSAGREADFSQPGSRRRVRLLLAKTESMSRRPPGSGGIDDRMNEQMKPQTDTDEHR